MRRPASAARFPRYRQGLLVTATGALAAAFALTGCQTQSPIQTQTSYQPADGINVTVGDVEIRDLVVVAESKGAEGAISGEVINNGNADVKVTFAAQDGSQASVDAPAHDSTALSGSGTGAVAATLPTVAVSPGGLVEMQVSTPEGGTEQVKVPVLLPQLYYQGVTPSSTPTTSPTARRTPLPPATSSPSASATATVTRTA